MPFPRMVQPVLSLSSLASRVVLALSSLASRVVLAQHLDTRELPRHLHRQMEDYRRLQGPFTIKRVGLRGAEVGRPLGRGDQGGKGGRLAVIPQKQRGQDLDGV